MVIAIWNIRGLNGLDKQDEVRNLIREHKVNVMLIIETKINQVNIDLVHRPLAKSWSLHHNYQHSPLGRIWIQRNHNSIDIKVLQETRQMIHCSATLLRCRTSFFISFVYGANAADERRTLWSDITRLSTNLSSSPWILAGDFNIIKSSHENFGGSSRTTQAQAMVEFCECLHEANLEDLRFTGIFFTWSNKSLDVANISRKLDRVLINGSWNASFSLSHCNFLPFGISDHGPMIITLGTPSPRKKVPFRFFNCWSSHDSFIPIVKSIWDNPIRGFTMFQVTSKLKCLKGPLKQQLAKEFSEITMKVQLTKEKLSLCQTALDNVPNDPVLRTQKREILASYKKLKEVEELTYRQKSRFQWLKEGDSNTAYFFKTISSRFNRNKITSLLDATGHVIDTEVLIKQEVLLHFQTALGQ
ncbi:uncharacterized protein LOC132301506 [Cornus florida]|uniref:uncharacterized protein LOC132301506 n=1 Tax=Cornus florida TaxID=4283 RepID=UPI00289FB22C|nr:uncharacterized protein LOC132301506 [Cornus florida]